MATKDNAAKVAFVVRPFKPGEEQYVMEAHRRIYC